MYRMSRGAMYLVIVLLIVSIISMALPVVVNASETSLQHAKNVPASVVEPGIVSDGSNFYIAYVNITDPQYAEGDLVVMKISSSGTILWTQTVSDVKAIAVDLVYANGKVFVAIDKWDNRRDIYYLVLDADSGDILKDLTAVAHTDDYEEYVDIAYNPSTQQVAIAYFNSADYAVYVALINANTMELITTKPIGPFSTEGLGYKSVTFTIIPGKSSYGDGFLLVYSYYNDNQKDLAAVYIYSDATTDTLQVPATTNANETVGGRFTIYNPLTGRSSYCYQSYPGGIFGDYMVVSVMAYTGPDESDVRLLVVDKDLNTKYLVIDSGGYPSLAIGGSSIAVAYRSTEDDPLGNIRIAILGSLEDMVEARIIDLSTDFNTTGYAEGYSKMMYLSTLPGYVIVWGVREENGDYRVIAVTVSQDGKISSSYKELFDTPGINDYPVGLKPAAGKVGVLIRTMIYERSGYILQAYDQNLTLYILDPATEIGSPTEEPSTGHTVVVEEIKPPETTTTPPHTTTTTTTTTTTPPPAEEGINMTLLLIMIVIVGVIIVIAIMILKMR